jgi:hypothetical protein
LVRNWCPLGNTFSIINCIMFPFWLQLNPFSMISFVSKSSFALCMQRYTAKCSVANARFDGLITLVAIYFIYDHKYTNESVCISHKIYVYFILLNGHLWKLHNHDLNFKISLFFFDICILYSILNKILTAKKDSVFFYFCNISIYLMQNACIENEDSLFF